MSASSTPELDGFEMLEPITVGEAVSSYLARQLSMDRLVSLFVLSERLGTDRSATDEFLSRVKALAQAAPACCPAIINVVSQGGWHFVIADNMPGERLPQVLSRQEEAGEDEVLQLTRRLGVTLGECAERGIVHGDLKASDVVVDADGHILIGRVGLLATVRSQSDLPVYVKRDMYSLGEMLSRLTAGPEMSEFSFADEAETEAASDGSHGPIQILAARLQGTKGSPPGTYGDLVAYVDQLSSGEVGSDIGEVIRFADEDDAAGASPAPLAVAKDDAADASPAPLATAKDDEALETLVRFDDAEESSPLDAIYREAVAALESYNYKRAIPVLKRLPRDHRDVAHRLEDAEAKLKAWYDHIGAGKALWEKNRGREAIERWQMALELRPNNKTLKQKIAQAKSLAGQEVMIHDYLNEAKRHCDEGDFPAARLACEQAMKVNPRHQEAMNLLSEIDLLQVQNEVAACRSEAHSLYSQKQYGPAIAMWRKAVAISLDDPQVTAEINPLIAQAKGRQRKFRIFVGVGVLVFLALLAGAIAVALSQ